MSIATLDPITFELLRSSFDYTCERMSQVLQRASFSPIIYDMVDYSNALFDQDAQLVGQTANCPVHLAAMHFSAQASIEKFRDEGLAPGDVLILNDPYQGGTHIPDITLTRPIFVDDEIVAYGVSRAHWTDLGGGGAGGQAFGTHVAAEGLRIPPLKLLRGGRLNEDIVDIIRSATRVPAYVDGDLQAQLGALAAADAEVQRLATRYGTPTLQAAMAEVLDYTERMSRAAIEEIPNGVYRGSDYADTDGFQDEPITVQVTLTIDGSDLVVDFEGSDPVALGAINSPVANTHSAVYYSLKFFLNPDAPPNAGMYRPIEVRLPENTWLNPRWPAPTIACTTIAAAKINSAIWQALAHAIPDRIIAPTAGEDAWFVASVTDGDGETHVFSDLPVGGWGATPFHDGMNLTMDPLGNCMNLPAESAELLFPVRYEALELRRDSGGAGRNRGGLGGRLQIRWLGRTELSMVCSRTREGAPGVNGGGTSPPQRQSLLQRDGTLRTIGGLADDGSWYNCLLANHPFESGEALVYESTGGGGWGDPLERDLRAVLDDVLDDYISAEAAHEVFGVVVDQRAERVDVAATTALRADMRRRRAGES